METKNFFFLCLFLVTNLLKAENEPNDNCSSANLIQLDQITSGSIQSLFDKDYFKISIPIEGTYALDMFCKDTGFRISILILNENCDQISVLSRSQGIEKINCNLIFCNPGIYYFKVSNASNTIIQEPYYFNLVRNTTDIHECNNSFLDAFDIKLDERVDVLIDGLLVNSPINNYNFDQDEYFKLLIPSKGILKINIFDLKGDDDLNVIVYDKNENFINCICCIPIGSDSSVLESLICEPGDYIFKIKTCNSPRIKTHTSCSFIASFIEDVTECNNSFNEATLIEIGQTMVGYFGALDSLNLDIDYYKFKPGKIGLFNFDFIDFNDYVEVNLYDNNYNLIQNFWKDKMESTNSGNYPLLCDDQYYYFSLKYANNLNNCDPANNIVKYSFKMNILPSDPYECNNKFEDAFKIYPNQILYPFMDNRMDDDYFLFNLRYPSEKAIISISDIDDQNKVTIFVYDKNFRIRNYIVPKSDTNTIISQMSLENNDQFYLKVHYNSINNFSPIKIKFDKIVLDVQTNNPKGLNPNCNIQTEDGVLKIYTDFDLNNYQISIFNYSGILVKKALLSGTESSINVSNLTCGIYFINFKNGITNLTKKFIVF